jgi:hypothetical protein
MSLPKDNITVNGLWIGKILNLPELLTINSFINNGHKFVLWAYDEIETELPADLILMDASKIIPKELVFCYKYSNQFGHGKGSYAGFSDIFRYKLLYEYGGWWTDMDVCCLKALDFEDDFVFRTHHSLPVVGNIMKCPPKSELMENCYKEAINNVDENNRDWHLPIQILADNIKKHKLEKHIRDFSNPDSWDVVRKMLKSNYKHPKHWYVIHWVNEEWRRNCISKTKFLRNSLFYKQLQKHGLNSEICKGSERLRYWWRLTKLNFGIHFLFYHIKKIFGLK